MQALVTHHRRAVMLATVALLAAVAVFAFAQWVPSTSAVVHADANAPPANLAAHTLPGTMNLRLSWDPPDGYSGNYTVRRTAPDGTVSDTHVPAGRTSHTDPDTDWDTSYEYRVSAADANGPQGWSNSATATTPRGPGAPASLSADVDTDNKDSADVSLSWDTLPRVQGSNCDVVYQPTGVVVYRQNGDDSESAMVANLPAAATGYDDDGMSYGQTYTYVVRAMTAVGEGPPAKVVVTPVRAAPPPAITGVEVKREGTGFRLWWDAPEDDAEPIRLFRVVRTLIEHDEVTKRTKTMLFAPGTHATRLDQEPIGSFRPSAQTKYQYHVQAVNAHGKSASTPSDVVVTQHALELEDRDDSRPRDLNVTARDGVSNLARLRWRGPAADASGVTDDHTLYYIIHRRTMSSDTDWQVLTNYYPDADAGTWLTYTDQNLNAGERYLYKVQSAWWKAGQDSPVHGLRSRHVELTVPSAERLEDSTMPVDE